MLRPSFEVPCFWILENSTSKKFLPDILSRSEPFEQFFVPPITGLTSIYFYVLCLYSIYPNILKPLSLKKKKGEENGFSTFFSPQEKCMGNPRWYFHRKVRHQSLIIIWINLRDLMYLMLYTDFWDSCFEGSREGDLQRFFIIYEQGTISVSGPEPTQ